MGTKLETLTTKLKKEQTMKNKIIQKEPEDIITTNYKIYTHGGRLFAEGNSRWQGSTTGDRLQYVGDDVSEMADSSLEYLVFVVEDAVYNLRNAFLGTIYRGWKMTNKGYVIE